MPQVGHACTIGTRTGGSSFGSLPPVCRHTARRQKRGRGAGSCSVKRSGACLLTLVLFLGACFDLGGVCIAGLTY